MSGGNQMHWFTTGDGRLINLDQVTDIEPSTVYRMAGQLWLNPSSVGGGEEVVGACLNLNGRDDNRYLLIDDTDLARLRALITDGGAA